MRSHSVSPFRSELLCFTENRFFFPQILFMMTLFFIYKMLSKQVPAGACDLAEIYQINIFYAVLSSEVNQEVTLIYLTTHWLCFCQCITFSYRRISNGFCNVSLNSFCGSAVCLWAVLDFLAQSDQPVWPDVRLSS